MLENRDKPVRRVYHRNLESVGMSPYRRQYLTCKVGLLMVNRNMTTLRIMREDRCSHCGQKYYYLDTAIAQEILPPVGDSS